MHTNLDYRLQALLGLLLFAYGTGMAFFAWRLPNSPYYPIFKPRWRWGIKASRGTAWIQAPLHASLGVSLLLGAFHSFHSQVFFVIFLACLVISVGIFFVDWVSENES